MRRTRGFHGPSRRLADRSCDHEALLPIAHDRVAVTEVGDVLRLAVYDVNRHVLPVPFVGRVSPLAICPTLDRRAVAIEEQ